MKRAVEAVQAAKVSYKAKESEYLFSTRRGEPYTSDGFRSIWYRRMEKAVNEGVLKEKFREHDLRAKTASDTDLEHAASLLSHSDSKTTKKHYRRKAEIVEPLR